NETEQLRLDIYNRVNAQGIVAQGLGGLTTVLDVKINEYPTQAACKPVALIPNCAATRQDHVDLDGSGAVDLPAPKI
ncbi:fumarate hydratase, partial [Francisella tularensis subsp. holarctica]|uniref:fumarate hydratase n=1 Tax=Francisella tularensis TaxID=263 RepID=UPI002381A0FE